MGLEALNSASLERLPFSCGVCPLESWTLLYANSSLLSLLAARPSACADSLAKWLERGTLEVMDSRSAIETAQNGRMVFKNEQGEAYLIYWWADESFRQRYVSIHSVPARFQNGIDIWALREWESILDSIHDGIWVIDANGITTRINRSMERIAGIKASEVVGRHVSEPLREGRFKTCVTLRALEEGRTVTLFDDYSNGKRCLNTSMPVKDREGRIRRVIALIRDLTELDELKDKLSSLEVEAMAHRLMVKGLEGDTQDGLIGQSDALQTVLQEITRAAHTDAVTLILGETGTGKSLAARLIHNLGNRSQRPFVVINCGAIPPTLMESELFGYERGAFTGANRNGKPGMLELASGGTLLLDEIGELSLPMQTRLLHILDGQPVFRVGSTKPVQVNARILAATNRSLEKMVAAGEFREDLFYRLRVLCMEMPPLRERREDILLLAWHFLRTLGGHKSLSPEVEKLFLAYAWPGNVRELQSMVQSLATLCDGATIMPDDLPVAMRKGVAVKRKGHTLAAAVAELEKEMIANALAAGGSTYKAAQALGVSQSQIARKAKKYGLLGSVREQGPNGWRSASV